MTDTRQSANANDSDVEKLQTCRARVTAAQRRRTELQVRLEAGKQQLQAARDEALAQFGTADITTLREQLANLERQNAEAFEQFAPAIAQYEAMLTELEGAMQNPAALAALLSRLAAAAPPPTEPDDSSSSASLFEDV